MFVCVIVLMFGVRTVSESQNKRQSMRFVRGIVGEKCYCLDFQLYLYFFVAYTFIFGRIHLLKITLKCRSILTHYCPCSCNERGEFQI